MSLPFINIRELLSLHGKVSPEKSFLNVISDMRQVELPYAEFNARSHQSANFLQDDLGIQPGDIVALVDDEPDDMLVLLMACWLIGAAALPFSPLPSSTTAAALQHNRPTVVLIRSAYIGAWHRFMERDAAAGVRAVWNRLPIIQLGDAAQATYPHFHTLVRSLPNTFFNSQPEPSLSTPALMRWLDRNTLTQGGLLLAASALANQQTITGNQHFLSALPLWDEAQIIFFASVLLAGGTLSCLPVEAFDPGVFWQQVAASRIHITCLTPAQIRALVAYGLAQQQSGSPIYGTGIYQQDVKQLRHIYCPDSTSTASLSQEFIRLFPFPVVTNR